MKLNVTDPRKMLIARMQVYAYSHVRVGDYRFAQGFADNALAYYDGCFWRADSRDTDMAHNAAVAYRMFEDEVRRLNAA